MHVLALVDVDIDDMGATWAIRTWRVGLRMDAGVSGGDSLASFATVGEILDLLGVLGNVSKVGSDNGGVVVVAILSFRSLENSSS